MDRGILVTSDFGWVANYGTPLAPREICGKLERILAVYVLGYALTCCIIHVFIFRIRLPEVKRVLAEGSYRIRLGYIMVSHICDRFSHHRTSGSNQRPSMNSGRALTIPLFGKQSIALDKLAMKLWLYYHRYICSTAHTITLLQCVYNT